MTITYESGDGIYVNITNRCTNSCEFCVRSSGDGIYGDLWLEREPTKEEIAADILNRDLDKYTELVFCGYGEPTIRLYELLYAAKKVREVSDIPIRINTNGHANLINNRDVTPELYGLVDVLSISLNNASAADYVRVCRPIYGEAAYDAIFDFAKKAKQYVKRVVLSVVRGAILDKDIETCRMAAKNIGVELRVREYISK